ncbi:outer membrane beta-barrel protein [uncultured Cohaesibacter sp.]|uniref:outer membrane protein n=1 Tax=uncultured Cohaesibacter sp. TaxID=1002546 RepID=UPI0029C89769|nr:outer membrane beta-barrel protein [uncultured Cohaesibacter sp.]
MRSHLLALAMLVGTAHSSHSDPLDHGTLGPTSWSGPYAGLHMGVMTGDIEGSVAVGARLRKQSDHMNGVGGGVLLGWNNRFDDWVVGVEGDLTLSSTKGSVTAFGYDVTEKSKWDSHIRLRAGYLLTPDILAYAAGGLAISPVKISTNYRPQPEDDAVLTGWSIGGGIEANLFDGVKGRIEYIYDDYPKHAMFDTVGDVNVDMNRHTIRAAVTFDLNHWMN